MKEEKKVFSGIDLAEKIMEFVAMTPDAKEWNVASLYYNPPREIRLRQIQALMLAFIGMEKGTTGQAKFKVFTSVKETKPSINYFLTGDFIRNRTQADYQHVVELIKAYIEENSGFGDTARSVYTEELAFIFPKLFKYKTLLRQMLTFNSGWMDASSITAQFSIILTNTVSQNLIGKYELLDRALEWFINPLELSFTLKELIAGYGYPKENLAEIDMDHY